MAFSPDLEALLKRPRITKPEEEFLLPGLPEDPEAAPEPVSQETGELPPPRSLRDELLDEAAEVQALLELLTQTAATVTVELPEESAPFLGRTRITTTDYLESFTGDDPHAGQLRQQFEYGLLLAEGPGPTQWPILAAGDLTELRDLLLGAAETVGGTLLTGVPHEPDRWPASVEGSPVGESYREIVLASQQYRLQFGRAVFTMRADMTGELLEALLGAALDPQVEKLKPVLRELIRRLTTIRALLVYSQVPAMFEYFEVRDALASLVKQALLRKLLDALGTALYQVQGRLVEPVLDLFEQGLGRGPLLGRLGDRVSREVAGVLAETCGRLQSRYLAMAADLLRSVEAESQLRLQKLQVLGERSKVGRWIVHLDQVIALLEQLVSQVSLSRELTQKFVQAALTPPPPPSSPLLDRLARTPLGEEVAHDPLPARALLLSGGAGDAPVDLAPDRRLVA